MRNFCASMRLGLVTDIHSHHAELCRALELFRLHDVEKIVTIGDTCDVFRSPKGADRVAAQLAACGAVGVWGNHDFSLCRDVSEASGTRYDVTTLNFMEQMQPRLEIEGCYFSHKDASVDPCDAGQLWTYEDDTLDLTARARAGLAAVPNARQFVGHYHRWWAATEDGPIDWSGAEPLTLRPGRRYFVIVAAVFQGHCAVFDTVSGLLEPLHCGLPKSED